MNNENIKMLFCRITGTNVDKFPYSDLIEKAAVSVEERLSREPSSQIEISRCEYAAAAQAVYEYAVEKSLSDRILLTENGAAYTEKSQQTVNSAYRFRNAAFSALKDMAKDDGFLFMLC